MREAQQRSAGLFRLLRGGFLRSRAPVGLPGALEAILAGRRTIQVNESCDTFIQDERAPKPLAEIYAVRRVAFQGVNDVQAKKVVVLNRRNGS